ncbi:Histone-lysine N-methyltransferase SETMAR [Oopsacas minuta]|uniref:Histone-lysine N-methyltransferase SETMAR n=1 Tax=Oopsacas minuta TaxID=111878 RepID=A0AAV7JZS1_9METZ|nr:Histone-lysine N-methyltransferase SETMAR [Oopsacas minuta]
METLGKSELRVISTKECLHEMQKGFGDDVVSLRTIQRWYREFKMGKASFEDEPLSGRPNKEVISEMVGAVDSEVFANPHNTYKQLEETLKISSAAINSILHEHLLVRKLSCWWVPHKLTEPLKAES